MGISSYATHSLQAVQHEPFDCKDGPSAPFYNKSNISFLYLCAIFYMNVQIKLLVILVKDGFCQSDSCNNAIVLY